MDTGPLDSVEELRGAYEAAAREAHALLRVARAADDRAQVAESESRAAFQAWEQANREASDRMVAYRNAVVGIGPGELEPPLWPLWPRLWAAPPPPPPPTDRDPGRQIDQGAAWIARWFKKLRRVA